MMAIANVQYAWTLFTIPLQERLGASLTAIQWAFGLFILTETWMMPFHTWLVDRFGARVVVAVAGVIVGASWIGSGLATSVEVLWIDYAFAGIGVGAVYGACVGVVVKTFPERRGLCVGATVGAYGFGTALTVIPISRMIAWAGYSKTFIVWGIIQGTIVIATAWFMKAPRSAKHGNNQGQAAPSIPSIKVALERSNRDYTPIEMLRSGSFYLMYAMMALVACGGLMVTAQLGPIASSFGHDKKVIIAGLTALQVALLLDRIVNGFTRPFWGWVSDRIGRYDTMALAFGLEAVAIACLTLTVHKPTLFVLMTGFTFFAWGEIYSLFPTAIADMYGSKYATTNFGLQYTSKGVASILAGPGAALLMLVTHSWVPVLLAALVMDLGAALLAFFWLKPLMRRRILEELWTEDSVREAVPH